MLFLMSMTSNPKNARDRLARNLRAWRSTRKLSQEVLAEHAGLSRVYVSRVENCAASVSIDAMEKLAEALQIDIAELLAT